MSLIYVVVNGDDAPAIIWYDKVNSYTLEGKKTAIISPKEVTFNTRMFNLLNDDGTTESISSIKQTTENIQAEVRRQAFGGANLLKGASLRPLNLLNIYSSQYVTIVKYPSVAHFDNPYLSISRHGATQDEWNGCKFPIVTIQSGRTYTLSMFVRIYGSEQPYIDIPIQHCNGRVLASMRRSGSAPELRELFARLREQIPGMVLRTTGLVGFPGETEEESNELLDFVQELEFDYTSVFPYSREEGTLGASLPDQVDEGVKLERAQRLLDVAEQLGFAATARHVGETCDVIVDGVEEGEDGPELVGHAWFQAPDCDGAVHIPCGEAAVGDVVRVRLEDSFCYELVGSIVE